MPCIYITREDGQYLYNAWVGPAEASLHIVIVKLKVFVLVFRKDVPANVCMCASQKFVLLVYYICSLH